MGSTSMHRSKGTTNEDWFLQLFTEGTVFHACGTVNGVFYAAVEYPETPGQVHGYVALTWWAPNDYYNFTWKAMSEDAGPVDAHAPQSVLDALTPTEVPAALEWRHACQQNLDQRKALRGLRDGDVLTLTNPITFTDGIARGAFTVRRRANRGNTTKVTLVDEYGTTCRVPHWQFRVSAVTRDGVSTLTPRTLSRAENTYVDRVNSLAWAVLYGRTPEKAFVVDEFTARYGTADPSGCAVKARAEYRAGNLWDDLASLVEQTALACTG